MIDFVVLLIWCVCVWWYVVLGIICVIDLLIFDVSPFMSLNLTFCLDAMVSMCYFDVLLICCVKICSMVDLLQNIDLWRFLTYCAVFFDALLV